MRLLPFFSLLFALVLSLSGCVTTREQAPQIKSFSLKPARLLRFSDVPCPAGFELVSEQSFILESGEVRAGILKYTGKANAQEVVLFYKAQMPMYNWALLSILEHEEHLLNFERENESCIVAIRSRGSSRAEISVSLAPKSPISVPRKKVKRASESLLKTK